MQIIREEESIVIRVPNENLEVRPSLNYGISEP